MAKFLVVGDVHGDLSFASGVCRLAVDQGVTDIFQVGDFGVWDHTEEGVYFLETLDKNSELRGVNWTFVAGNHENYDRLENYAAVEGIVDTNGMVGLRPSIWWTGRTNVWDYKGLRMAAFGGAYSIDKANRREGVSWWSQEMPTQADLYDFEDQVGNVPVDFLFTHDSTVSLPEWPGFFKADVDSAYCRNVVTEAYNICKPEVAFHGHYHRELQYTHEDTQVFGLGCNYEAQMYYGGPKQAACALVDTENDRVKFISYLL
jgi:predicted phosphodiesterase